MSDQNVAVVRSCKAADAMTTDVVWIDGSATVVDAIKLMRKRKVSSLLVERREPEDAWGIVTRKDIVHKIVDPGKNPKEVHVFEIMSKPLIVVSSGLTVKYCARLFYSTGIRRAPVVEEGEIIGILSNSDIFDAIYV